MLEDIVNSKVDSAILSFFLAAPERSFSVLEVSKRLGIPYLKVAHSLSKLSLAGPLKGFSKKNKKYYLINSRYALLPEMKNFWNKNGVKYNDELFSAIRRLGEIKAAFLSGIFCGEPNLPVDLLLVGKVNLKKLSDFLKAVEKLMGQEINYSVMSLKEFLLRRDTFDKFIKDIFDYHHLIVVDNIPKKRK
ncbi:MAG TPA: hypothetical protein VE973_00555 [Candidatus Limnocylindria bacterium]|nr:hypothetical protein [Candidatus Limnocylindria bacterium]